MREAYQRILNSNLLVHLNPNFKESYTYKHKQFGSGAVAGKILLVTNACWIRDCWDVPGSTNGVCEGNIARSGYKTAYKKILHLKK